MNRVRTFKPELFAILEIPERQICERQLSGFLLDYTTRRRHYFSDGCTTYINLTPKLQRLTGLYMNRLILSQEHKKYVDWWELVSLVSKRWKA